MTDVTFVKDKHIQYVIEQDSHRSFEYWLSEHLRMNGLYWGITTLATINSLDALPKAEVIDFILSCWDDKSGGFGSFPKHDSHILSTLSALQVLRIYDNELTMISSEKRTKLVKFIKELQLPDGSFQGDRFGEVDTRFVYTAISALSLLDELTKEIADPAVDFIMKCRNFDGSFGMVPGAESHAAQVFVCVGTLAITDNLHLINQDIKLASWLSERQVLPSGGFNGRPEKLPDVCYSWWVLSSLAILNKKHWVDLEKLEGFILSAQDLKEGGISDRPDNATDIYHTCFGITGLSLIDWKKYNFKEIDPIYCMPVEVTKNFKKWKNLSS
ncbi:type II proteins geranylgeranyltransferase beta subunit [Spathaspora passalidarum NRRL Y-27907]|uniref:Geranylgeranyl transferase type-2 subunit beta n=1 Tax=Spathaspora passalidarum (strain NRRL Y-27907 / 11-Y1) TaxID=619300 RepID=G3AIV9_SPAPN|nr:type II proteins geranylgeranyltransferase beta subunit [Spathaspora passalidarum NRRL Y-27907]EGW33770.1 type II proteins geranylgeranyltransferase beta subunit [Spathaspora passalidarum NRRL Y-27907]